MVGCLIHINSSSYGYYATKMAYFHFLRSFFYFIKIFFIDEFFDILCIKDHKLSFYRYQILKNNFLGYHSLFHKEICSIEDNKTIILAKNLLYLWFFSRYIEIISCNRFTSIIRLFNIIVSHEHAPNYPYYIH